MKNIILVISILSLWNYNGKAQTATKPFKLDVFSLELGTVLAQNGRFGVLTGLGYRANNHLLQLQFCMEREFSYEVEWLPSDQPKPAKILGLNYFSLLYGYSVIHKPKFQLTPSIGLTAGRELYRTGEYDEIEGFLWNTYAYYKQINEYLGVSGSIRAARQYHYFGLPMSAFGQLQIQYYGRATFALSSGLVINLYNRKPAK